MESFEIIDDCLVKCNITNEISHIVSHRIKKIGEFAFSYCHQLERLYLSWYVEEVPETNFVDRSGVFKKMLQAPGFTIFGEKGTEAERVAIQAGVNFVECTEIIKDNRYCYYLGKADSVVIPNGIKYIEHLAFINARHVKNVVIPNGVEYICSSAFKKSLIEKIVIPASVKAFDGSVFKNCKCLYDVIFENGNTRLDNDCFVGCNENLVIKAPAGGFVEEYAKQYNLNFEAI
jgi:hypothetical protein